MGFYLIDWFGLDFAARGPGSEGLSPFFFNKHEFIFCTLSSFFLIFINSSSR